MSKRVIIDFDGTITKYCLNHEDGPPQDGVKEALQKLRDMGYYISIFSCRTSIELFKNFIDRSEQQRLMESYLEQHEIPFDEILMYDKPIADFYIDDRNIEFKGKWEETIEKIRKIENGRHTNME